MWLDIFLKLLITITAVAVLLWGWLHVQALARRAAERHPEAGPYRDVVCGGHCGGCGRHGAHGQDCDPQAQARARATEHT